MRKKLSLLFFITITTSICTFGSPSDHLLTLRSKFPYGLLGDDHEILTMDDLAINACRFKPYPFPPENYTNPYEYWQCFESKNISPDCDSSGIPDEQEGVGGLIVVKAVNGQTVDDYIERRTIPIKECKSFVKDLRHLLQRSSYACISGSFIEIETDKSGTKTTSWLFERLKTSKGCEGRDCKFTAKMRRHNCPDLKP